MQKDISLIRRDEGCALALSNTSARWCAAVDSAILFLAARGEAFTAEHVREIAGDPPHPNAMGGAMIAALRAGIIVQVGYAKATRAERNGSILQVYRGVD